MFQTRRSASGGGGGRLIIGIIIAVISLISYFASQSYNPVTGENQYLSLTPEQEIALGLQSAPQMIQEFGGLHPDDAAQSAVNEIGSRLINTDIVQGTPWRFSFSVLDDPETVNAFALPGGPTFITSALLNELETEDEVAGVMAHEIVHVLARHSAQQIATNDLTNGLIGAVGVASGDAGAAQTAAVIGQLISMRYGREDEIQSDTLGVCLMIDAGYDPNAMIEVMRVLEAAGGGSGGLDWFSTHPSPDNRVARIEETIANADSVCPS